MPCHVDALQAVLSSQAYACEVIEDAGDDDAAYLFIGHRLIPLYCKADELIPDYFIHEFMELYEIPYSYYAHLVDSPPGE